MEVSPIGIANGPQSISDATDWTLRLQSTFRKQWLWSMHRIPGYLMLCFPFYDQTNSFPVIEVHIVVCFGTICIWRFPNIVTTKRNCIWRYGPIRVLQIFGVQKMCRRMNRCFYHGMMAMTFCLTTRVFTK